MMEIIVTIFLIVDSSCLSYISGLTVGKFREREKLKEERELLSLAHDRAELIIKQIQEKQKNNMSLNYNQDEDYAASFIFYGKGGKC
jgi:hypothetical protein